MTIIDKCPKYTNYSLTEANERDDWNWFILAPKTRYDTSNDANHEVLHRNCTPNCCTLGHNSNSWKTNRPIFSESLRSKCFSSCDLSWRIISEFFIDLWKKRGEKRTATEQQLRDHGRDLVREFNLFQSSNSPSSLRPINEVRGEYVNWNEYLRKFRYRREFLQHLLTGHESVYILFREVVERENHYVNLFNDTFSKVRERIRMIARELGIPDMPTAGFQPSFPEESVALYIINEIDLNGRFEVKRDSGGSRNVVSNNKWFLIQGFDQLTADNLISKLNSIIHDPELQEAVTNYRTIRRRKDMSILQFKNQLEMLLRGVELKTKDLAGGCDQCLQLHNQREIRRLRPLLSQIDQ